MHTAPAPPQVTVVVVTWQGAHLLPACLLSLRAQTLPHALIVVDNASTDGTGDLLRRYPEAAVIRAERNLGFAGGAQLGIDAVETEFVALINNDAVAEPTWLEELVAAAAAHPSAAAVTSLMLLSGRDPAVVNNAGVVLLPDGYGTDRGFGATPATVSQSCEVFGFSGGAALLRMRAIRDAGGFARHFFLYYEDTDLSWRLRLAGWTVWYQSTAVVHHQHSASADQRSELFAFCNERNRLLMLLRCGGPRLLATALARFLLTTASLALRRVAHPRREVPYNLRPGLRLHVLASVAALSPAELRVRRDVRGRRRKRALSEGRPGPPGPARA